jgi:glycerophosphoryl diester phosphodiesterase
MGHRGDPNKAPENTMLALKVALEGGVDFLESDIRLTSDNELVLFHDDDLRRTTGKSGLVRERKLEELRQIDFGYMFTLDGVTFPFRDKGLSVVSLREAFNEFPQARFVLDIKDRDRKAPHELAKVLEEYERTRSVAIASFIPKQMKLFREIMPEAITSAHPGEVRNFVLGTRLRALSIFSRNIQYQAFQVPIKSGFTTVVNERFVEQAHKRGIAVQVWTINDKKEMEWLIELGVDGIFTDEPSLLREVLSERGML